ADLGHAKAVGTAAGAGPRVALLNRGHRREVEAPVRDIEEIETALEPHFQELFVNARALPNKVDPFPRLAEQVALPARKATPLSEAGETGAPRRRSREERAARRERG